MVAIMLDANGQLVAQRVHHTLSRPIARPSSAVTAGPVEAGLVTETHAQSPQANDEEAKRDVHPAARSSDEDIAVSTRSAYRKDIAAFKKWGGTVPCDSERVAQYIEWMCDRCAFATIQRHVYAIGFAHDQLELPSPIKRRVVRKALRIAARTIGTSQRQAKPITRKLLLKICKQFTQDAIDCRDRVVLLLGFAGGFRRSEIASLRIEDLVFEDDGLLIRVRRSKTDQTSKGRKVAIPATGGSLCPVRAVRQWLKQSELVEGSLLRRCHRSGRALNAPLDAAYVSTIIKNRISAIGEDPTLYSGHSLRTGLVTEAARAGVPSWKIKQQTGHRSDANLARYIRDAEIWTNNAAARSLARKRKS